jgi:hypothetical protein
VKAVTSVSTVVLWTHEPFAIIRPVVESVLVFYQSVRRTDDLMWTCNAVLATLQPNWLLPEVRAWSQAFTSACDDVDLEFLFLAVDPSDQTQILTSSKNHLLSSSLRYLQSEAVLHDVAFDDALSRKCIQAIKMTTWPTEYCLMLHSTGLFSPKIHLAYAPSTNVYLPGLLTRRNEGYLKEGTDLRSQTLNDVVIGMKAIGAKKGWLTKKL